MNFIFYIFDVMMAVIGTKLADTETVGMCVRVMPCKCVYVHCTSNGIWTAAVCILVFECVALLAYGQNRILREVSDSLKARECMCAACGSLDRCENMKKKSQYGLPDVHGTIR